MIRAHLMPAAFRQTTSALDADSRHRRRLLLGGVVVGLLLLLWAMWFVLASVPLYAVSESARVQASSKVHPVDIQVSGRVVSVHLPIGGQVAAGDVLIEVDPVDTRLRLEETRARRRGLVAQIEAVEAELVAWTQVLDATEDTGRATLSEAAALRQESEAQTRYAVQRDERIDRLRAAGVVPDEEREHARAELEQRRASATARARRVDAVQAELLRDLAERRASNASLARSLAELRAELESVDVQASRLEVELERHTVRAPIAGRLGQVAEPQVGSVVAAGQTVAVVAPEGALEVVAEFSPSEAVGRIREGNRARMRVDAFPWTRYGMLDAVVVASSGDAKDGRIQVRLAFADDQDSAIPRTHGLSGTVEVELEEVSPAILVMREAGGLLSR